MGTYTITFDTKGGETAEDITAESGSWQAIAKPVRAGHVFDGWVVTGHDRATAAYSSGSQGICSTSRRMIPSA